MSDGGWYGYPPQEPDPYAQPQDDWNRPPLDYGNAPQAPEYDQYGQPVPQQPYYQQQQQAQQPPRQAQQPPQRPQPRPQGQQQGQGQYRPAQSQNPYVQQPGQEYGSGSYPEPQPPQQQPYPSGPGTGQQPAVGNGGYRQPGYDTGSYGAQGGQPGPGGPGQAGRGRRGAPGQERSGYDTSTGGHPQGYDTAAGYEQAGYGSGTYDAGPRGGGHPAAGGGANGGGAGGGRRRAGGAAYGEPQPRDPYSDLGELADEEPDEYEYPGRGARRGGTGTQPRVSGTGSTGTQSRVGGTGGGTGTQPRVDGTGTQPRVGGTGTQPRVDDEGHFALLGNGDGGSAVDDVEDEDDGGRKGGRGGKGGKSEKKSRRSCLVIFLVFAIVAGGLGYGGYQGYKYYEAHYGPPADYSSPTGNAQTVVVTIPSSATGSEIGEILYNAGVIESQRAFTQACNNNSQCANVQADTYLLHKQMSAAGALTALLDPSNVDNKSELLVKPGERAADVFADLEQKTGWSQSQILSAISSGQVDLPSYATAKAGPKFPFANVEGLLFTGTYELPDYKTPTLLIKAMIDRQVDMFNAIGLTQKASSVHMSPYQVLTVASMARAEAGADPDDLSKIAGVIYTRLKSPQFSKLGFDTSTLYGLGRTSPQPTNAELQDSSNPYNLRAIAGLPPGPIDSVDQTALTAALSPTDSTDVYFCAVDGTVYYASSDTQWAQLGKQYPGDCG